MLLEIALVALTSFPRIPSPNSRFELQLTPPRQGAQCMNLEQLAKSIPSYDEDNLVAEFDGPTTTYKGPFQGKQTQVQIKSYIKVYDSGLNTKEQETVQDTADLLSFLNGDYFNVLEAYHTGAGGISQNPFLVVYRNGGISYMLLNFSTGTKPALGNAEFSLCTSKPLSESIPEVVHRVQRLFIDGIANAK